MINTSSNISNEAKDLTIKLLEDRVIGLLENKVNLSNSIEYLLDIVFSYAKHLILDNNIQDGERIIKLCKDIAEINDLDIKSQLDSVHNVYNTILLYKPSPSVYQN